MGVGDQGLQAAKSGKSLQVRYAWHACVLPHPFCSHDVLLIVNAVYGVPQYLPEVFKIGSIYRDAGKRVIRGHGTWELRNWDLDGKLVRNKGRPGEQGLHAGERWIDEHLSLSLAL